MKLKNRFIFIIIGTFVVPLIISILVMIIITPEFVTLGNNVHAGARKLFANLDSIHSIQDMEYYSDDFPDRMYIILMDDADQIVFRRDNAYDDRLFLDDTQQQTLISRRLQFNDGRIYTVIIGSGFVPLFQSYMSIVIAASIIIFLSLLSYLTIRSINRSIKKLEEGTRRIAEGDMDTPITIKGDQTFENLARSFDTMRLKVKEEYDRRTRFFMGVSHDLKTPLASITGYSDALLDGLAEDAETHDRYLRIINAKGKLLDHRIAQLIKYIKLTNNDFQSNLEPHMIVPFLEDFCELQKDEASLNGGCFEKEILIDPTTIINFDQDLLSRAMENILQNSFRYGDINHPVRMICQYYSSGISISYSNHHTTPISKDVLNHMFEPFYRGDQARRGEGFGLGLATVKSIVESHGWSIEVKSLVQEEITVFQILIPYSGQNSAIPNVRMLKSP